MPPTVQPPVDANQAESLITLNRALLTQQLLRGVTHDLRNNLQVVALGSSLGEENRGSAIAVKVERALDDMVATLDLLSHLGRPPGGEPPVSSLESVLNELRLLSDLQRNLPTLRLSITPPPVPVLVAAPRSPLLQVLLNLVSNAKEASGRPTEQVEVTATIPMDGRVAIMVDDSGPGGQPAGVPFVTTKDRGLHGGLGVFCCRTIVERLGGEITWEPRPERGLRARLVLPISDRG